MKKCFVVIITVFLLSSCKSVKCLDMKACDYFEKVYERIEDNYNSRNKEIIIHSGDYIFIYSITGIQSEYAEGIDFIYIPSKENLQNWKKWFKNNKDKLYWDEKSNTVKVKY